MLVVDQLKKNDPHLRLVALVLMGGLCLLLTGLWWVQVVSAGEYQNHLNTQAFRTIRIPAVRGKILDREGRVLAENRPRYNLSLYLDDLNGQFKKEYDRLRPVKIVTNNAPFWKFWSRAKSVETNRVRLKQIQVEPLIWQARYNVINRLVVQEGQNIGQNLTFDVAKFKRHYVSQLAMPFSILQNLNDDQIARFQENFTNGAGADLELQSIRNYPFGTTAAHLLGFLRKDSDSLNGEEPFFNYRLTDYRGVTGIEGSFDSELHGRAGIESVLVNNLGYRQSEDVGSRPAPGNNVVLTIDLDLQRAAEQSLLEHQGANVNAAVVVMDVRNGDVLAMVSSPTYDPNAFAQGVSREAYQQIQDLSAEKNRATYENYAPGSIFKPVVSLAALEAGLDPEKYYTVLPDPENPGHGLYENGRLKKRDTAPPGKYNFKHAIERSSNSYFIQVGLETGIDRVVTLAKKFHLGEKNNLPTRQETHGDLPTLDRVHHAWRDGDTANLCIGQGELSVTPLQMAVAYSAIANGGTVLWPQLVSRIEPQNFSAGETATNFPSAVVRDRIGVSKRSLWILHEAMLGETEDQVEGTGKAAVVPGLRICGKTGTAQVQDSANRLTGYNYWFASFAPYENPKYAVVVMVQKQLPADGSGGKTCAPIAHDIYEVILKKEKSKTTSATLANAK